MKALEELGISHTPWKLIPYGSGTDSTEETHGDIVDAIDQPVLIDYCPIIEDARFIAAAPKLYNFLRDAVIDVCYGCRYEDDGKCTNEDLDCHVKKWRAALAEASGEEVC